MDHTVEWKTPNMDFWLQWYYIPYYTQFSLKAGNAASRSDYILATCSGDGPVL